MDWTPPPTFEAGQIASAAGHLNVLADACNYLLAQYQAPDRVFPTFLTPWGSYPADMGAEYAGFVRIWTGWIRHKADTLSYSVQVTADGVLDCRLRINYNRNLYVEHVIAGGSGTTTTTGTVDISGLALDFYIVSIDYRCETGGTPGSDRGTTVVMPQTIEEIDTQSYTTPATFADGTTPTAADWNLLSTQLATLYDQLQAPRPMCHGYARRVNNSTDSEIWSGWLTYLHRYLYYDIRLRKPYNAGTVTAKIYVNGTQVGSDLADAGANWYRAALPTDSAPEENYFPFVGAVDLSSLGLSAGTRYLVQVKGTHSGTDDDYTRVAVNMIHGQQPSSPTLTGWSTMPIYARGTSVTGTASMKAIRDNVVWLTGRVVYRNQASALWRAYRTDQRPLWSIRYHRYLHYRCEKENEQDEKNPSIGYWYNGWQETDLPVEANTWQVVNLNNFPGLFVGAKYQLRDVTVAIEDADA